MYVPTQFNCKLITAPNKKKTTKELEKNEFCWLIMFNGFYWIAINHSYYETEL